MVLILKDYRREWLLFCQLKFSVKIYVLLHNFSVLVFGLRNLVYSFQVLANLNLWFSFEYSFKTVFGRFWRRNFVVDELKPLFRWIIRHLWVLRMKNGDFWIVLNNLGVLAGQLLPWKVVLESFLSFWTVDGPVHICWLNEKTYRLGSDVD